MQTDPQDRAAQRMAQQRITDARDDVVKSDLYDADEKYELLRMMDMIDQDFGLIEQDQISAAEQTLQSVGGMGLQRSH